MKDIFNNNLRQIIFLPGDNTLINSGKWGETNLARWACNCWQNALTGGALNP